MPKPMKIDFISDIACPWCAIGLGGLEQALANAADAIDADLGFQPFELNPAMPAGGHNVVEHLSEKYGTSAAQSAASRQGLIARAAEVGFAMAMTDESRLYNTFDAHRLLHWAKLEGRQKALKKALFAANFTDNRMSAIMPSSPISRRAPGSIAMRRWPCSTRIATRPKSARPEQLWQSRGISSVPAIVIDDTYLISGGPARRRLRTSPTRNRRQVLTRTANRPERRATRRTPRKQLIKKHFFIETHALRARAWEKFRRPPLPDSRKSP